jgi:dihydrofolate reductase
MGRTFLETYAEHFDMHSVALIAAVSDNGVIGKDGKIPWHISEDLRRFKQLTKGHTVIMGRKTHVSIGMVLPGRQNIVLSRDDRCSFEGCAMARSFTEALAFASEDPLPFVIGGEPVFREALPYARYLYLTHVHCVVDGDVRFPTFDPHDWRVSAVQDRSCEKLPYHFIDYERNS